MEFTPEEKRKIMEEYNQGLKPGMTLAEKEALKVRVLSENQKVSPRGIIIDYLRQIDSQLRTLQDGKGDNFGTRYSKLQLNWQRYKSVEHDEDVEKVLEERYKRIMQRINDAFEVIEDIRSRTGNPTQEDLEKITEKANELNNLYGEMTDLTEDIKHESANLNVAKLKIKRFVKATADVLRRLDKGRTAAAVCIALGVSQLGAWIGYNIEAYANEDYFQDNYVAGETAEELAEGDLREIFSVMTSDELRFKKSDVRQEQYEQFSNDFTDILSAIDEYVVLANKENRTPEDERKYHALAIRISDYEGYVDLNGEAIGFNRTMELMIKAKLANAIEDSGSTVKNFEEDINICQHEADKDISAYKSVNVEYVNSEGEFKKRHITDETFFIMANSGYLSAEIASLTEQIGLLHSGQLSIDQKVEIIQVVAAMSNQNIQFNEKNGKFSVVQDKEEKETTQTREDEGR